MKSGKFYCLHNTKEDVSLVNDCEYIAYYPKGLNKHNTSIDIDGEKYCPHDIELKCHVSQLDKGELDLLTHDC